LLEETLEHFRSPEAFKIPDGRRAALYEALKGGIAPDFGGLHQTGSSPAKIHRKEASALA
jgi:hypothetical protein